MGFHLGERNSLDHNIENDIDSLDNSTKKVGKVTAECIVKTLNLVHILPEDRDDRRCYIKLCIKRGVLPKHRYSTISKEWLNDYLEMLHEEENNNTVL